MTGTVVICYQYLNSKVTQCSWCGSHRATKLLGHAMIVIELVLEKSE